MGGRTAGPDKTPIDDQLQQIGGFGRYQAFTCVVIVLVMHTGALLGKGFPILERPPSETDGYVCHNSTAPDVEYLCSAEDFCGKPDVEYSINYNNTMSFYNLYTQYDLVCKKKFATTLLNMLAFFSAFLGCTFVPRCADLFGRKVVFVVAVVV